MSLLLSRFLIIFSIFFLLQGCNSSRVIVNGLQERDANEIIVFLNGKNIKATKVQNESGGGSGGPSKVVLWNVVVPEKDAVRAMDLLDQEGLPRKLNTNLLQIFGNSTLVPSEMQETIRYHAGLGQQIANTIKQIDGILDANVVISFPETDPLTGKTNQPITASVYVKHNGILDDPNLHLISKIKRLVSSSVTGLAYDNVTVVADRTRLVEPSSNVQPQQENRSLVDVWSIELEKASYARFLLLFFSLLTIAFLEAVILFYLLWKFYHFIAHLYKNGKLFNFNRLNFEDLTDKENHPLQINEKIKEPNEDKEEKTDKEIDDI